MFCQRRKELELIVFSHHVLTLTVMQKTTKTTHTKTYSHIVTAASPNLQILRYVLLLDKRLTGLDSWCDSSALSHLSKLFHVLQVVCRHYAEDLGFNSPSQLGNTSCSSFKVFFFAMLSTYPSL